MAHPSGENEKKVMMPDFDRWIMIDFQGGKLSPDTGFSLMRELDQRHNVISPLENDIIGNAQGLASRNEAASRGADASIKY